MASGSPTRCRYPGDRHANQRRNSSARMKLASIRYARAATADPPQSLDRAGEGGSRSEIPPFDPRFPLLQHDSDLPNDGSVKTRLESWLGMDDDPFADQGHALPAN